MLAHLLRRWPIIAPTLVECLVFAATCGQAGLCNWARILVQVMIYRRILIGRDGHLDQSEAYDIS